MIGSTKVTRCLPKNISYKKTLLFCLSVSFCSLFSQFSVFAEAPDWILGEVSAELTQAPIGQQVARNRPNPCQWQKIFVAMSVQPIDACVFQAKSFRLAYSTQCLSFQFGCLTHAMFVSSGYDTKFYQSDLLSLYGDSRWLVSPASDDIMYAEGGVMLVINSTVSALELTINTLDKQYELLNGYAKWVGSSSINGTAITSVALSSNGKWLVGSMPAYGLFRMHLSDNKIILFTDDTATYDMTITNDGKFVATGNNTLYRVDDNCGSDITTSLLESSQLIMDDNFIACPKRSFSDVLTTVTGVDHSNPYSGIDNEYIMFNEGGDALALLEKHNNGSRQWIRVKSSGYVNPVRLEYLAMGDSYSSGEGDVGKKADGSSYYLPGTEARDQCHISSRSYPFLLRDHYDVSINKMKSVACSGARVLFDYILPVDNYLGQRRQLANNSEAERGIIQQDAIADFTPGLTPQLEFVKKYKPEVITLTGGGNDIGFADIITYCALPYVQDIIPFVSDCEYAKGGSELQKMLFDAINTQYLYNKILVEKIKKASPDSRIIIVGYPSFISNSQHCSLTLNSGSLSQLERMTINLAVTQMNAVLQKVAYDTSVSYADIEGALNGGRMCEGSEYITGVTAVGYKEVIFKGNVQELFHPNAAGHVKIKDAIVESRAFTTNMTPADADYIYDESAIQTLPAKILNNGRLLVGSTIKITTNPFMFQPFSYIKVVGFSDRVNLGEYHADKEGRLDASIDMTQLPIGKHLLLLEGNTSSGEPIKYYQFIDVVNPQQSDDEEESHQNMVERQAVEGDSFNENSNLIDNGLYSSKSKDFKDNIVSNVITDSAVTTSPKEEYKKARVQIRGALLAVVLLVGGLLYVKNKRK